MEKKIPDNPFYSENSKSFPHRPFAKSHNSNISNQTTLTSFAVLFSENVTPASNSPLSENNLIQDSSPNPTQRKEVIRNITTTPTNTC